MSVPQHSNHRCRWIHVRRIIDTCYQYCPGNEKHRAHLKSLESHSNLREGNMIFSRAWNTQTQTKQNIQYTETQQFCLIIEGPWFDRKAPLYWSLEVTFQMYNFTQRHYFIFCFLISSVVDWLKQIQGHYMRTVALIRNDNLRSWNNQYFNDTPYIRTVAITQLQ